MASGAGGAVAGVGQLVNMGINVIGRSAAEAKAREGEEAQLRAYLEQLGILPPQLDVLDLQQQEDSQLGNIEEDAQLRAYQMQALEQLGDIVGSGGMTDQDRAAYQQARANAGMVDAGLRGAAQQRAQQLGGVQNAYVGDLLASQAAVNQANQMGVQAASDSRERYLKALDALSGQSSNVRAQDYAVAANAAQAQDAINRFNTGMRWDTAKYNQGLSQQNFQNQMALANQRAQAAQQYDASKRGRANDKRMDAGYWGEQSSNLINTLGQGAASGGSGGGMGSSGGFDMNQLMDLFGNK